MNTRRMQRQDSLILVLFAAICFASCFFRELANVDEMWNFTFGANVARDCCHTAISTCCRPRFPHA